MVSHELVHELAAARRRMTRGDWQQLATKLAAMNSIPDSTSTRNATAGLLSQDAAWILAESFRKYGSAKWSEIAVAMTTVDFLTGDTAPLTEIIWTGPANSRFPVRRIDQVLYDLVSNAKKRIVLVTFAAHRVRHLCTHLTQAVNRGVELTLIVESEGESEGQLIRDAIAAFSNVSDAARIHLYYWPLEKRERNAGLADLASFTCKMCDC